LKAQLRITFIFLLIATVFGLLLRGQLAGYFSFNFKNILHTHSHVAILGWMYNAALVLLQFVVFKKQKAKLSTIFWVTQTTFVGMLFSFPFQGYAFFSILFSTLYLFCSYFLVYQLFKQSSGLSNKYVAQFLKWAAVFLVLSSLGPYFLAIVMAKGLADTYWYKLAIYWFLHFLYNGFFVAVFFAYLLHKAPNLKYVKWISVLTNWSVIPLFTLSVLWLKPHVMFYVVAAVFSVMQLLAFILLINKIKIGLIFQNLFVKKVMLLVLLAYGLKVVFQLLASFPLVQTYINSTVSYSVIGYIHLVMLGVFTLFFIAVFMADKLIKNSKLIRLGVVFLVLGIIFSEVLIFSESIAIYFLQQNILNLSNYLFWISMLMPLGVLSITVSLFQNQK